MAYETKVLLISIAQMVLKTGSQEELYKYIMQMANAEGVVLKSYDEAKAELESLVKKWDVDNKGK